MTTRSRWMWVGTAACLALAAASVSLFLGGSGDPRLAALVRGRPPLPVVFTSRTESVSFRAAAAEGDYAPAGVGARGTGQPQWQAREGRLRILTPDGAVQELTWGKELAGGGTLIDVMSPSVAPNGDKVVFAGRCATRDGGRFRIYSVSTDGDELRQLTGGPDDPGCVRVPPLRFDGGGAMLDDTARKRLDYDDVDPHLLDSGILVFASSRMPDTGGRGRRATQIWVRAPGAAPHTISASRANDRWPALDAARTLAFSVWSRQDEVVSADGTGLTREPGGLTAPTDRWFAAGVTATGEAFGQVVKLPEPAWRPRPLGAKRWAFMSPAAGAPTPFTPACEHPEAGVLRVGSAAAGSLSSAPSSLSVGGALPPTREPLALWLNPSDAEGRAYSAATPSFISESALALSAAPLTPGAAPSPGSYGLYSAPTGGWSADGSASQPLSPLFDDPDFVDAEPVAVPARSRPTPSQPLRGPDGAAADAVHALTLFNGTAYKGAAGRVEAQQLSDPLTNNFPGQQPRDGTGPIIPLFPQGALQKIAFYSAHRDRFDDPERIVVPGTLEKLLEVPVAYQVPSGRFTATLPVTSPTLLVGLGADGKVVSAPVGGGGRGTLYAFAGDHVSGIRPGGYTFCTGCHAGHSGAK